MTKRGADAVEDVAVANAVFQPCGLVPALTHVLFDPHMACNVMGACQVLDLDDLWNLYQCCRGTWKALANHPDIVVYREGRIEFCGNLDKALCRAFIERRDHRLLRCVAYHREKFRYGTPDRVRVSSPPSVAWQLACGVSTVYVEFLKMDRNMHIDAASLLECASALGSPSYMRRLAANLDMEWPLPRHPRRACVVEAVRYANLELLEDFALYHHVDSEEVPNEYMLRELASTWLPRNIQNDDLFHEAFFNPQGTTWKWALARWPEKFAEGMASPKCFSRLPWQVEVLKVMLSERNRQGLSIDYEQLYVRYMSERHDEALDILNWLYVPARRQFRKRKVADKHAVPLFMGLPSRNHLREWYLEQWGLQDESSSSRSGDVPHWNMWPYNSDRRHYMYGENPPVNIDAADVLVMAIRTANTVRTVGVGQ